MCHSTKLEAYEDAPHNRDFSSVHAQSPNPSLIEHLFTARSHNVHNKTTDGVAGKKKEDMHD